MYSETQKFVYNCFAQNPCDIIKQKRYCIYNNSLNHRNNTYESNCNWMKKHVNSNYPVRRDQNILIYLTITRNCLFRTVILNNPI